MNFFTALRNYSVRALAFLLPWQTRLILVPVTVGGVYLEYATISLYATEMLAGFTVLVALISYYTELRRLSAQISLWHTLAVLGILCLILVSVFVSSEPWLSWYTLYRLALSGGVALVMARSSVFERTRVWWWLWFGGVGQGVLALYQFFTQHIGASSWLGIAAQSPRTLGVSVVENTVGRWLRAYGSFGWPTSLGIYLAVVLIVGIVLYMRSATLRSRLILISGELVVLAGCILTFARGAWVGAIIGGGVLLGGAIYRLVQRKDAESAVDIRRIVFFCSALVVLAFVYGYIFRGLLLSRLSGQGALEERSLSERSSQYHDSAFLVREHPWWGVGPGLYSLYLYEHFPTRSGNELQPVHNIYVLLVVQHGFLLLMAASGLVYYGVVYRHFTVSLRTLPPFLVVAVAGCFDHWPVSLWSGLLLTAILSGSACIIGLPAEKNQP